MGAGSLVTPECFCLMLLLTVFLIIIAVQQAYFESNHDFIRSIQV